MGFFYSFVTYWIAPDQVRQVIAQEIETYKNIGGGTKYLRTDREELVAYQQR